MPKKRFLLFLLLIGTFIALPSSYAQCEKFIGSECAELEWQFAHTGAGEVAAIAIAPSNPAIVYAGLENNAHALYKSLDGGIAWKRLTGPGDHAKDIAVSPKDAQKVYVATSEALYSTDKAIRPTSRSRVSPSSQGADAIDILSSGRSPGPSVTSLVTVDVFPGDDKILYAAVKGGYQIMGFGDTNPEIFKTIDGGSTWKSIKPKLEEVNVIAIHPSNHEIIFIGADDGIYKSVDSGKNAERIYKSSASVISLEILSGHFLVASSEEEIIKSADGGKTWEEITGNLENIHRVKIAPSNPDILYAATWNGVFKSADSGKSWEGIASNLKAKNFQVVEVHPTNPDIAFVGTSSLWSSARAEDSYRQGLYAGQGIFKTTDGGNTWQKVDKGFFEYNIEDVATNPAKPYEAWFAGQASMGAHKTEDAGQHWRLTQTPTFHYPMRIKFSRQDPKKVYATGWQEGGPFSISDDGGVNWEFVEGKRFFDGLARGKELYASISQGPATIHIHGLAVDPNNDDIVYAGSIYDAHSPTNFPLKGAHLWKSTDGGKSWKESDDGFPHEEKTAIHDIAVDPQNANILYAATTSHESEKGIGIYKSIDAGKSWKEINNGLQNKDIGAIAIHPERTEILLAATHGGIYKSANAGTLWKKTSSAHSFDVEYVKDMPSVVYASTNDGVLKSRDFGDTWYKVNYGLPKGEGQGIGVDPTGNVIYAAVRDKGIYVARLVSLPALEPVTELGFGRGGVPRGPGDGFGFPGKEFPGFPSQDKQIQDFPSGFPGSEGKIPDFDLEEICEEHTWPPSCNFIPDKMGREICQKCKALERDKENILIEKEESKKEEIKKQEGFFARIANFFKRIFSLGKKQGEDKSQPPIMPSSNASEQQEQIEEIESIDEPQPSWQDSIYSSKENKLLAIGEECAQQPLIPMGEYKGLLTDAHVHTMSMDNPSDFAFKLLEEMNEQGVDRIVIQPGHNPNSKSITMSRNLDKLWGDISTVCPRIIPLIYGFNPDEPDAWEYVQELLNTGNYGGVGEIEFQHGNLPIKHDPESESMIKIYQMLNEKGLALHFQASIQRDPSLEEKMFKIIQRYPNISFIWFGGCPFTEKFIRLPNLYCDIFLHSKAYLPQTNVLQKSIIGSDAGPEGFWNPGYGMLPYRSFGEAMEQARKQLGDLPANVKDPLAHGNFNKIWKK